MRKLRKKVKEEEEKKRQNDGGKKKLLFPKKKKKKGNEGFREEEEAGEEERRRGAGEAKKKRESFLPSCSKSSKSDFTKSIHIAGVLVSHEERGLLFLSVLRHSSRFRGGSVVLSSGISRAR